MELKKDGLTIQLLVWTMGEKVSILQHIFCLTLRKIFNIYLAFIPPEQQGTITFLPRSVRKIHSLIHQHTKAFRCCANIRNINILPDYKDLQVKKYKETY